LLKISAEHARRSILARQGLIEPFGDPLDAVRAMVAVQTQYAASLATAVAARTARVPAEWDERALAPGGALIKSWSVRNTLHAHLPEDHALILGTIGERAYKRYVKGMTEREGVDISALEAEVEAALANGPLTRDELHTRLPYLRNIDFVGWGLDVMGLAFQGRVCVVGRGSSQCFCVREPQLAEPNMSALLRRYFEAFGPATIKDFSHWTGVPMGLIRPALEEAGQLERIEIEGIKGERLASPGCFEELPGGSLGVRLLAKFDPLILAHHEKGLFLRAEDRPKVFRIAGQVEAVVLSEGVAAATWRLDRRGARGLFSVEPFRAVKLRERGRIEKEAEKTAKKLGLQFGGLSFVE
jgi:hypothetical protein